MVYSSTDMSEPTSCRIPVRDAIFSELALREGKVPPEVIDKGRKVHEEMASFGIARTLSSILVERNLIDRATEKEIVKQAGAMGVPCAHCRQRVILAELNLEDHIKCGHCGNYSLVELDDAEGTPIERRLRSSPLEHVKGGRPGQEGKPVRPGLEKFPSRAGPVPVENGPGPEHRPAAESRPRSSLERRLPASASTAGPASPKRPEPAKPETPGDDPTLAEPKPSRGKAAPEKGAKEKVKPPKGADAASPPPTREARPVRPRISARKVVRLYRIESAIAEGPHGRLYRARPVPGKDDAPAAVLKAIAPDSQPDPETARSLRESLQAWKPIDPARPYSLEQEGGLSYIARPFIGPPLVPLAGLKLDGLTDRGVLLRSIAAALRSIHAAGKVHGNLKPSNIFLQPGAPGEVVLADPLLTMLLPREESARWQAFALAPAHCSPESIGGAPPSPASDIYSLGWIFYEVLAGAPPFAGLDPSEVLRVHRCGPCPELPASQEGWRELHLAMTALRREERPADGGEVLDRIDEILAGKKPSLRPVTPRQDTSASTGPMRLCRGFPWRNAIGPAALALVLAWVGFCLSIWSGASAAMGRNGELLDGIARETFEATAAKAAAEPASGGALWDAFLRSYPGSSFQAQAEAERQKYASSMPGHAAASGLHGAAAAAGGPARPPARR